MPKDAIGDLLKDISKKHDIKIGVLSEVAEPVIGLSTGNLAIDYVTGIDGLPLGRSVELYGPPSSGKAQPLDALVLTPYGYVKMGEIRPGTVVCTANGGETEVASVHPQGVQPVYRLTFSDGSTCEATADHLWAIEVWVPAFGYIPATVTTAQLQHRLNSSGRARVRLPRVQSPQLRPPLTGLCKPPIAPYLLGLLLGDGGFGGRSVLFITKDAELLDAVRELIPDGCDVVPQSRRTPGISWRINGLPSQLREIGLLGLTCEAKYVPEIYKHLPATARLALLQGLMDTDGHATSGTYNAGHGTGEFSSVSRQLRDDVLWLARSLGLKAAEGKDRIGSYRRPDGTRVVCKPSYRVKIHQTAEIRIFRLPRKLVPVAPGLHQNRDLVRIEYVRDAECQCIALVGPHKVYLTNDFIPTHNTTCALQAAAVLQSKIISEGRDEFILYLDHEHALDADYAAALGLDVEHESFLVAQPYSMEQGAEAALKLIDTGKVRLSIWDSVASMAPIARLEGEFDQRTAAMNKARLMSGLMLQLTSLLHKNNCCAVFINHLMESVEMSGRPGLPPKIDTPGGKGLKFYASMRLEYRQIKNIKGKAEDSLSAAITDQAVATHVRVRCVKNKVAGPSREAEVRLTYGRGFDNTWSALQVLLAHKSVRKDGAWYRFDGILSHPAMAQAANGKTSLQGEAAVLAFAVENPDWADQLVGHAVELVDTYGADALAKEFDDGDPLTDMDLP